MYRISKRSKILIENLLVYVQLVVKTNKKKIIKNILTLNNNSSNIETIKSIELFLQQFLRHPVTHCVFEIDPLHTRFFHETRINYLKY